MAKTRKLEFYGYHDQNDYDSLSLADIDSLEKVNKEQDDNITTLSSLTMTKADANDVARLNCKVNKFMCKQDKINKCLGNGMNTIGDKFNILSNNVTKVMNKIDSLSGLTNSSISSLTNVTETLNNLSVKHDGDIENVNTKVDGLSRKYEGCKEEISSKLDKEEAFNTYAKKGSSYTKLEVDSMVDDANNKFATMDWVTNKHYITKAEADGKYTTNDGAEKLKEEFKDLKESLTIKCNGIMQGVMDFQSNTSTRIDALNKRLDTYKLTLEELSKRVSDMERSINKLY